MVSVDGCEGKGSAKLTQIQAKATISPMRYLPTVSKTLAARRGKLDRIGPRLVGFLNNRGWFTSVNPADLPIDDLSDRIGVASALIVLGLGASLLLSLAPISFESWVLGSPVSLTITATTLMAGVMGLMAAAVAESVVRTHPLLHGLPSLTGARVTWMFWALPVALVVIATLLLPLAPTRLIQALALLMVGGIFAVTLTLLHHTVEQGRSGFRRARILLNVLTYGSALLLFLLVYQTRTRSLLSGSLVALTATLLAVELLRTQASRPRQAFMYATITGAILGQVTWALNYWRLPGLTGGLLLTLIFYLVVGMAQQGLQTGLTRRVLIEFAVFTLLALVLIAVVGPGFEG